MLVTGATGYVGWELAERLVASGQRVRAMTRRPDARLPTGVERAVADAVSDEGLAAALDGCSAAYYLIHSMEPTERGDWVDLDRRGAENFARAGVAAGLEHVIYLGGIAPSGARPSPHLASRVEVEAALAGAARHSTAFRASIVVGARSAGFRLLVRLIERLRVLPLPGWRHNRTQPIDERDAFAYLLAALSSPAARGRSFDIGGPDVMSYAEIVERIAERMLVGRAYVRFRARARALTAPVVARVTGLDRELVGPLMESLDHDLVAEDSAAREIFDIRLHRFDAAVERALREWEREEVLAAR